MKRRQTEIQIRVKSGVPYLLLQKTNKNYYLSLYFIENYQSVFKFSSQTYFNSNLTLSERINLLVSNFIKGVAVLIDGKELVLRITNKKITSLFYGIKIVNKLKESGLLIKESF